MTKYDCLLSVPLPCGQHMTIFSIVASIYFIWSCSLGNIVYRTGGSVVLYGFIDNHQYIGVSAANVVINDRAGQTRITSSLPNNAGYDDMLIYFFFELKGHKNCPRHGGCRCFCQCHCHCQCKHSVSIFTVIVIVRKL